MGAVSKTAFLHPLRRKAERYPLPEYGEGAYVVVQALTSLDIVALQNAYGSSPDSGNLAFVHELLSRALVDDAGQFLFDGPADVAEHFNMSLPAMEEFVEFVLKVSGIDTKRTEEKN